MRLIKGRSFYKEPWYNSYRSMMDRCYRENAKNYGYLSMGVHQTLEGMRDDHS